ncbi:hypothetical protein LOD99_12735 [Oopsacas minuta]|uniref:Uncharacterized protein n=1 Tax=Oopsacas minuta TaxID=111878 RepID=A0AAV7JCX3_9METZ|nr:hypothetical protein LOD99_12735 [Oopsacas minuta]
MRKVLLLQTSGSVLEQPCLVSEMTIKTQLKETVLHVQHLAPHLVFDECRETPCGDGEECVGADDGSFTCVSERTVKELWYSSRL